MLGCCAKRAAPGEDAEAPSMLFPMWVLPISTFIAMTGPPKSHQELKEEGKLVQWKPGMFCLFVSHQWVSFQQADPVGVQLSTLRKTLQRMLQGQVTVQSNLQSLFFLGKLDKIPPQDMGRVFFSSPQRRSKAGRQGPLLQSLSCPCFGHTSGGKTPTPEELRNLENGYIWFDWYSIPQITVRRVDVDPDMGSDVKKAVDSIPAYVEVADLFVVLCPSAEHQDTRQICNQETWGRRGWCRVELAAAALGRRLGRRLLEIRSPTNLSLMCPNRYFFSMPGKGDFTVESDKIAVHTVMMEIVAGHLDTMWRKGPTHWTRARLITAMRGHLMAGLGTEEQQAAAKTASHDDLDSFLQRFRFNSLTDMDKSGFGPVHCAVVAGNLSVLRQLAAARADLDAQIKLAKPELLLQKGDAPLHLACLLNGDPEVVRCLIELRANVTAQNKLGHIAVNSAASAGNVECVEFLLDSGFNVNHSCKIGARPLHSAAVNGQAGALKVLLERGAEVLCTCSIGSSSLASATFAGSIECCRLLIEYKADVNVPMNPVGLIPPWVFRALRVARPFLPKEGPLYLLTILEGSTPLFFATFLGHTDIVKLLLVHNADPSKQNREGLDAFWAARFSRQQSVECLLRSVSPASADAGAIIPVRFEPQFIVSL